MYAVTFMPLLAALINIALLGIGIYVISLVIRALRIYIRKNS